MVELFIGIGSNTEREKHLNAGVAELQQIFTEVELSPFMKPKLWVFVAETITIWSPVVKRRAQCVK